MKIEICNIFTVNEKSYEIIETIIVWDLDEKSIVFINTSNYRVEQNRVLDRIPPNFGTDLKLGKVFPN